MSNKQLKDQLLELNGEKKICIDFAQNKKDKILKRERMRNLILYVSSTSVFIKGGQYELPTQNIDLLDVVGGGNVLNVQNKTFYVFVELVGNAVGLTFSINRYMDTNSLIYVGSVTTDDIGISSSNFSNISS